MNSANRPSSAARGASEASRPPDGPVGGVGTASNRARRWAARASSVACSNTAVAGRSSPVAAWRVALSSVAARESSPSSGRLRPVSTSSVEA